MGNLMKREEFVAKAWHIYNAGLLMSEEDVRARIRQHADLEKDLPVCIGELSELILELTRYQRGKMNLDDFLQELSHVQWAVWSLQDGFGISDEELRTAVQASFR